jgi:hypothetical protein
MFSLQSNLANMENITIIDSNSTSTSSSTQTSVANYDDKNTLTNKNYKEPKITYIIEPSGAKFEDAKRVIAIAYSYENNKNVKYGASIFRKINKTDVCIKSQIRETAIERFYKYPVCFDLENTSGLDKIKYSEVLNQIRYKMYKFGVKGREIIYNSLNNSDEKSQDTSIVTGQESFDSKIHLEPKISYILEPKDSTWQNAKRIIAIVYSYTNEQISYGACIFRRTFPNEECIKVQIRETAKNRFFKYPIILQKNNQNNEKIDVCTVLKTIRKKMYTEGVKQKNLIN